MSASVEQRRKEIEIELMNLLRQVEETDSRLRAYLADRERKPHPRHQELIEKVQSFRIDRTVATRQLEAMLDNLQWKVYYYNRSWRQLWENAESMLRAQAHNNASKKSESKTSGEETGEAGRRGIHSVDKLWDIQRDKRQKLGLHPEPEDKNAFVKRIKQQYGQLASGKKDDEEIVMTFDKAENRCTLEVKKRKN